MTGSLLLFYLLLMKIGESLQQHSYLRKYKVVMSHPSGASPPGIIVPEDVNSATPYYFVGDQKGLAMMYKATWGTYYYYHTLISTGVFCTGSGGKSRIFVI